MKMYGFSFIIISTVILSSMACVYFVFGDIHFTITNRNDFTQHQSTFFDFILIYLVISLVPSVLVAKIFWDLSSDKKSKNKVGLGYISIILYILYWLFLIYLFCILALEIDLKEITNTLLKNTIKSLLFLIMGFSTSYLLLYYRKQNRTTKYRTTKRL